MTTTETDSRLNWFCLRAQPRREHVAAENLRERIGIDVFAPRIRIRKETKRGAAQTFAEALFPGYLFARFRYAQQIRHVLSTAGVAGIVSFGARPPTVADHVIDFLISEVRLFDARSAAPIFPAGTWVKIVGGCFQQNEGRVLAFDGRTERVRVLLCLLGRDVQVSVMARQVVSIGAHATDLPNGLLVSQMPVAPVAG